MDEICQFAALLKKFEDLKLQFENVIKIGIDGSAQKRAEAKSIAVSERLKAYHPRWHLKKESTAEISSRFERNVPRPSITRIFNKCNFTKNDKMNVKPT